MTYRYTEKGEKVRVSTRSGHIIPKPAWERRDWKVRSAVKGAYYIIGSVSKSKGEALLGMVGGTHVLRLDFTTAYAAISKHCVTFPVLVKYP